MTAGVRVYETGRRRFSALCAGTPMPETAYRKATEYYVRERYRRGLVLWKDWVLRRTPN